MSRKKEGYKYIYYIQTYSEAYTSILKINLNLGIKQSIKNFKKLKKIEDDVDLVWSKKNIDVVVSEAVNNISFFLML
jgi:hypothetical protein